MRAIVPPMCTFCDSGEGKEEYEEEKEEGAEEEGAEGEMVEEEEEG